jgi:NAD(P)-dependent dehydrogenase (short-subunit alcohol dehydrogenase family)
MADLKLVPDRLEPLPLPHLNGRRVIVTGGSAGIGLAAATAFAQAGADVILGVRNAAKGNAAATQIRSNVLAAHVSVELIELGSLESIAAFAQRVGTDPVDLLVNNAGLSSSDPNGRTVDGFDLQVGVNYLGTFALTAALWPALTAASGRVVMLGSMMAQRGEITDEFGQLTSSTSRSYSDSKLAAVVFASELRQRCLAADSGVTAVAAHPGWAQTSIFDIAGPPPIVNWFGKVTRSVQSAHDGAQPILLAATAVDPALYYGPLAHGGLAGRAGPVPLPAPAQTAGVGTKVWEISERLTCCVLHP